MLALSRLGMVRDHLSMSSSLNVLFPAVVSEGTVRTTFPVTGTG
jgi:hypothetical protein